MKSFFDDYPEFYQTGKQPLRLGARYEAIIQNGLHALEGKVVLDLGAHNGRWSFAALKAGAKKVISIEGRQDMAEAQDRIFKKLGVQSDRYSQHVGDGMELMINAGISCDTVLLLGIYYHVHNHLDWVKAIRGTGAAAVITDTEITPCDQKDIIVRYKFEDNASLMSTPFESFPGFGKGIVGHPSRAFVNYSFAAYGYATNEVAWRPLLEKWGAKGMDDYASDRRSTFFAKRVK
jgi:predicted nicotinamide N-methyase